MTNVPAGQWAFSAYDEAAGHVRRYSIQTFGNTAKRNQLKMTKATYWGLPLVPSLIVRKILLMGNHDHDKILKSGFDSRTNAINTLMGLVSRCEMIPQKILGTSLMAVLEASH